jgi:hypothetical protein
MTVTQRDRTTHRGTKTIRRLRTIDIALLGAAAAFVPLGVMATNPFDIGHPERLLSMIGLLWAISIAVVILLVRGGVRSGTAVSSVFLAMVLLMSGGPLVNRLGEEVGWAALMGLLGAAVFLISRMESHSPLNVVLVALAAFLISGPSIALVQAIADRGNDTVVERNSQAVGLSNRPDIFLVVLDGYAGTRTLAEDLGVPQQDVVGALDDLGFEVPVSAWSAYPSTRSSVPSLLDMSYPLESGSVLSAMTERRLSDMLGGSNAISSLLKDEGYELVMIESGWSGSRCGREIDKCVASPFLDEAMFAALERTVAGPTILRRLGYAFTVGAQQTMGWLRDHGPSLSRDDEPTFVFGHIMAPHPPFFLDGTCRTTYDPNRSGVQFARPFDDVEMRRVAYLEQTRCLNDFMIDLGAAIDPSDIVIFVGDHGTDQRNQMARDPASWSYEDVAERLNVFFAVRAGPGCSVGDTIMLPNILRRVLSCISIDRVEDVEPRMFKYAQNWEGVSNSEVLEVDGSDVSALVGS